MATILIVDDQVLNREFLITLLGYGGHRLLQASDGAEGLALARAARPDLIISDILMPNMDGYQFVTRLRADPDARIAATPVIFYTAAYRGREAGVLARACGARAVLSKPCEPELILATVQQVLGLPLPVSARALPAAPEDQRLPGIDTRLSAYLGEIEAGSLQLSEGAHGAASADALAQMTRRVAAALASLQAVSLRLTALIELGIELAGQRATDQLLECAAHIAQNICVARYAAVGVLARDATVLERFVCVGADRSTEALMRAALLQPALRTVLARAQPHIVRVRRCATDVDTVADARGLAGAALPVNAELAVPIVARGQAYGWLYLADKLGADEFGEVDQQVAATVASQLAIAYERVLFDERLVRQHAQLQKALRERVQAQRALRQSLRERTMLAECNRVIVHAVDEADLLQAMCCTLVEVGQYSAAWIEYLMQDGALALQAQALGAAYGSAPDVAPDAAPDAAPDGPGDALACEASARAAASGRSCTLVQPAEAGPEQARWRALRARGCGSLLAVPLRDGARVFGVLNVCERTRAPFSAEQITQFEELVDDIAYGLLNLRSRAARAQTELTLQATQDKLSDILNSIDNVVWSASEAGLLYLNPVAERVYGRPLGDFFGARDLLTEAIHPEDRVRVTHNRAKLAELDAATEEYRIVRPDGSVRWLEQRSKAVRDDAGVLLRIDAVASDVTERKAYEERIAYLADHDELTDLANRHLLNDRATQSIRQVHRQDQALVALLFLDLDRFKAINDSHGHTVGDHLLQAVAGRLLETVREGDTVARQGGDEFIILLVGLHDQNDVASAVAKIVGAFGAPFEVDGLPLHVHASVGVAVCPGDGADLASLLTNADTAMYRAKDANGNTYQFYAHDMGVRAQAHAELESALRAAIEQQQFELYYQPKVELKSGRVVGAEALIRWHHPTLGLVAPQRFIALAEEVGLIVPIGEWALRTAHAQNKQWQDAGLAPLNLAVNLSMRQFQQNGLVELVARVLRETGLDGRYLELELTESMVMNNADQFVAKLFELKALGVQLSIDDFGTGYSSLSYLKRFPLDRIKIDQSFIRDSATNAHDAALTCSIIDLGHSLNFKVIAEGVETRQQLAFLRAHRCDEIQGYYFSEPVPASEFAALINAGWHLDGELCQRGTLH